LLAITALVIVGRRYRYLPVGWFWFLGTLVPTIGLMQVGRQALADRYAYQSFLGLFILLCWGAADLASRKHWPKAVLPTASVAILLMLAIVTHRQIGYWGDNLTLWSHAAQVTKDNWVAEDMVAGILLSTGHHDEAIAHYYVAAALNPTDAGSNLAVAIYEQGRGNLQEAIRRYNLALVEMDDPLEQAKLYQNLSIAYRDAGEIPQSAEAFAKMKKLRRMH
jgi:tetratricopeptide (TPR) repeat protein